MLAVLLALTIASSPQAALPVRPNFLIVLCDNLGYGDVGCFGSTRNRTPHLDRMAAEGTRFTSFYVTSGVCTPSRASIMTGCYPRRVRLEANCRGGPVLQPLDHKGLNPEEVTIAEVLHKAGYATACIGKWHLGDQPDFLPTRQGFDHFFGIPYSDDMTTRAVNGITWPELPLMRDQAVIEAPVDRNTLTRRYTEETIRFITAHQDRPWFVYLPQAMPGSTNRPFADQPFRGRSSNGSYGDAIEELDWSMGEIRTALRRLELDDRTLVIWTSDNGSVDRQHGSNRPLSGWGYTTMEGAMRVPCIVRWPGHVPAGGSSSELCTTMDLLPTLARLAGAAPPADRVIDGHDIRPLLLGEPGAKSPYEAFYYYYLEQLQAVRAGRWKLHLPLAAKWHSFGGVGARPSPAELYDLETDVGETRNVTAAHPEVVARLTALAERAREDLGDLGRPGKNQRSAGWVDDPQPRTLKNRP
jgi:arylsulfatase A-like enzyme